MLHRACMLCVFRALIVVLIVYRLRLRRRLLPQVPKCLYRVRAGEALVDVADKFGTSWLQLWALNKDIRRPEGHGLPGTVQVTLNLQL